MAAKQLQLTLDGYLTNFRKNILLTALGMWPTITSVLKMATTK